MRRFDDMNPPKKYILTLICLVLSLNEINTADTTSHPSICKYDITNELNQSIAEIFQTIDSHQISESLQFFKTNPDNAKHQAENTKNLQPFGDTIFFRDIETKIIDNLELSLEIRWEIQNNTVRIMNPEMSISMNGFIDIEPDKPYISFKTYFHYDNISIIASQSSIDESDNGTQIQIEYDDNFSNVYVSDNGIQIQIEYDNFSNVYFRLRHLAGGKFSNYETTKIQETITPIAASLISNHFNHNEKFLNSLKAILSRRPKQNILSMYPNFTDDDPNYCFIIRPVPYSNSKINAIFLTGLSSFQYLTVKESNDHSIYALFVNNVFGRLFIDHGIEKRDPVEFTFSKNATRPIITFDRETASIEIDVRENVSCFSYRKYAKSNWLSEYSYVIMQLVGVTVAKLIMPSMKIETINSYLAWYTFTFNIQQNIAEMLASMPQKIEEIDKWSKQSFNNLTTSAIRLTNSTSNEPYNYQISFNDMAIKVISGTPCSTAQNQSEFFKNLKIDHEINAIPVSKSIQAHSGSPIVINFLGNFTSINLAIIKPENSQANNTCSFEIHSNNSVKIIIPPANGDESKIKKKLDASMLSMVKGSIVRLKSLICYPIDICDQSVKIVDDFFQRFIDTVLRKCSLRRNNNSK